MKPQTPSIQSAHCIARARLQSLRAPSLSRQALSKRFASMPSSGLPHRARHAWLRCACLPIRSPSFLEPASFRSGLVTSIAVGRRNGSCLVLAYPSADGYVICVLRWDVPVLCRTHLSGSPCLLGDSTPIVGPFSLCHPLAISSNIVQRECPIHAVWAWYTTFFIISCLQYPKALQSHTSPSLPQQAVGLMMVNRMHPTTRIVP